MKVINFLANRLIQTIYAQPNIPDGGIMMCYAPMYTPSRIEEIINAFTGRTTMKIILLFIGPLTSLILAVQNALNLIKRKAFSVPYAAYKAVQRILILTLVLAIILTIIFFVFGNPYYYEGHLTEIIIYFSYFFGIQLVVNCSISGLIYMCFLGKGIRFLKLGLSLFFVVPGVIIFIIILPLSLIPNLNKYLPKDVAEYKRELLKKKLIDQGKFPEDVIRKNNEK